MRLFLSRYIQRTLTWMTPPPWPWVPAIKHSGSCSIFPNQSNITVSSSVQAGLAACKHTSKIETIISECSMLAYIVDMKTQRQSKVFQLPRRIQYIQWLHTTCQPTWQGMRKQLDSRHRSMGCASGWPGHKENKHVFHLKIRWTFVLHYEEEVTKIII